MSGVGSKTLMPNCTGDGREIVTAMLQELKLTEDEVEKLETVPYYELVRAYEKVCPAIAAKGGYIGGNPMNITKAIRWNTAFATVPARFR